MLPCEGLWNLFTQIDPELNFSFMNEDVCMFVPGLVALYGILPIPWFLMTVTISKNRPTTISEQALSVVVVCVMYIYKVLLYGIWIEKCMCSQMDNLSLLLPNSLRMPRSNVDGTDLEGSYIWSFGPKRNPHRRVLASTRGIGKIIHLAPADSVYYQS
jgi:hypothetical protein